MGEHLATRHCQCLHRHSNAKEAQARARLGAAASVRLTHLEPSQRLALGIVACLALAGAALVAWATPLGPSVGSDSVAYLLSTESLLSGDGLGIRHASGDFSPLSPHFPPTYSLGLAAAGVFDRDLTADARWINVLAFGLLVAIVGAAPILLAGDSPLGIMLSVVALSSAALLRQFTAAMSEPLFILLATLGMFLLAASLIAARRAAFYGAAFALAAAALTRYVGLAFVGAGGLSVLSLGEGGWGRRIQKALAFGLAGCLPLLVWLLATNRGGSSGRAQGAEPNASRAVGKPDRVPAGRHSLELDALSRVRLGLRLV